MAPLCVCDILNQEVTGSVPALVISTVPRLGFKVRRFGSSVRSVDMALGSKGAVQKFLLKQQTSFSAP